MSQAVGTMQEIKRSSEGGTALVESAGGTMNRIVDAIQHVGRTIDAVTVAATSQAEDMGKMSAATA